MLPDDCGAGHVALSRGNMLKFQNKTKPAAFHTPRTCSCAASILPWGLLNRYQGCEYSYNQTETKEKGHTYKAMKHIKASTLEGSRKASQVGEGKRRTVMEAKVHDARLLKRDYQLVESPRGCGSPPARDREQCVLPVGSCPHCWHQSPVSA